MITYIQREDYSATISKLQTELIQQQRDSAELRAALAAYDKAKGAT